MPERKPRSMKIRIPLRRRLAMIGAYARSRLGAQARAVAFVVLYLVAAQVFVFRGRLLDPASAFAGIAATVLGLAFFLEGLFLGIMPLGERCGLRLPGRAGLGPIMAFAMVLGVTATLAEPAIGILKLQGGAVRAWDAPLLYLLLNRGSGWLVAAVAAGVGLSVAVGMLRFLYRWPLKPFLFIVIPMLVAVGFLFEADPNLRAVAGLAWDTGGVTTGPVTVPLVIALGIGVSRIVGSGGDASGGLGVVTLASALPVAAVFALAAALLPLVPPPGAYKGDASAFFAAENRAAAAFVAGSEESLASLASEALAAGDLSRAGYDAFVAEGAVSAIDADSLPAGAPEDSPQANALVANASAALKAVLPLALVLILTLVILLRDRLTDLDTIGLGLAFAVVGMFLFSLGMDKGLTALGTEAGRSLPRAYERTERLDKAVTLRGVSLSDVWTAAGPDGVQSYVWMDGPEGPAAVPFDEGAYDEGSKTYRYVPVENALFSAWGEAGGYIAVLAFVFLLGFGATLAEPSLSALGTTVEDLTTGTYKKATLVAMVGLGVGLGMISGFSTILFDLPRSWMLGVPYALALLLTAFAPEDFAAIAWDCGGVTTGPVTVPLVIAAGLGIGGSTGALSSFGVVAASSVYPIVAVLASGLWKSMQARRAFAAQAE